MSEFDDLAELTPDLAALGWTTEHDEWAATVTSALVSDSDAGSDSGSDSDSGSGSDSGVDVRFGRIARVSRGYAVVFTGGDALLAASSSVRANTGDVPATGDFVVVTDDPEDGPTIAGIAPRATALQRRAAGKVPEPQVLAANIDSVFVMHGLDRQLNVRRLERQLVIAWDSGAIPVVVLTKSDRLDGDAVAETIDEASEIAPGVEVVAISTVTENGIDAVKEHFTDRKAVALLGLSGIGKSSLVNVLSAGRVQRIGEVRATDRRGRHTTVTRDLIPLPQGGFAIDTPGLREIGLWQAYEGIDLTFAEIAAAAANCRFADCGHSREPGCGVQEAIGSGAIEPRRIQHWRELQADLELQESQLEEFARRAESRDRADAEDARDRTRSNRRSRSRPRGRRRGR